jgi:two-component system, chemotaxis family, sensor kinase CheA
MISAKYKDLYLSNSKDQLKKLSNLMLSLEKSPQNQNLIENIFRLVHSMKGAAATMGYKKTVNLFHAIENVIDAAYNQSLVINKKTLDILFASIDAIEGNFDSIERKNKEANISKNITIFKGLLKKVSKKVSRKAPLKQQKHILGSLPTVAEISVPTEKLDKIQRLLDGLLVNTIETKNFVVDIGNPKLMSIVIESDKIVSDLRRELEKIRIVPLAQIFSSLPYLVREIARDENKKVELFINDNGLSLDKSILDELVEILIQLLKNAVAHGITTKQQKGKIILDVSLVDDRMLVSVEDNGQGINWQYILEMAIKNRITSKAASKKMTIVQIRNLIFQPGISRGAKLSTTSGRGVGLSLVRSKVQELGGDINIISKPGKGTCFKIDLPLPMSIFRSLQFKLGGFHFAVPLAYVENIIKMEKVKDFSKAKSFSHKKKKYKLFHTPKIVGLRKFEALSKYVALIKHDGGQIALPIYSNIKEDELIMKRTPQIIKSKKYIKGVAVSAHGKPVLILNVSSLN